MSSKETKDQRFCCIIHTLIAVFKIFKKTVEDFDEMTINDCRRINENNSC